MAVEESRMPGQDDTNKKFYHVRAIEIKTASSVGIGKSHTPIIEDTAIDGENISINSIADLFAIVKRYDKEFLLISVNSSLLNADGTPKGVYHGTEKGGFTVFSNSHSAGGYWFADEATAKSYIDTSAMGKTHWSGNGVTSMCGVYLNIRNPLVNLSCRISYNNVGNRRQHQRRICDL